MHFSADRMLHKREDQSNTIFGCDGYYCSYYSPTAIIVKWVLSAIVLLIALGIILSYLHANSRLRKGLQPLPYHRWLVRRRLATPQAYNFNNQQQPTQMFTFYNQQGGVTEHYQPPPPVYNPQGGPGSPPVYSPPVNGEYGMNTNKVDYTNAPHVPPPVNTSGEGASHSNGGRF